MLFYKIIYIGYIYILTMDSLFILLYNLKKKKKKKKKIKKIKKI